MATRKKSISNKIRETLQQYSKRMCTRVTIFWMLWRIAVAVLIYFKPEIGTPILKLTEGVDTAMIINMSVYTANSTVEKVSLAYFGKRFKDALEEGDDETADTSALDEAVEEGIQNG